ncbi:hypothetical protein [Polaribacter glomeratus]|uniref:Lipocalin-like domain-containing protein n=1 Tax=Polaribacter glomeratus TaxID=102 RepID=A0A2S7WGV3_9FLAO|nr:hypothetical protein [Polaribacter glomeratus]PQJ76844.1 hypothetical protein BTO16_13315 [Polaribacter glomeratus]TXD67312.1 hypothetical protein ESX12_01600 [Polaribacter glomeratus]
MKKIILFLLLSVCFFSCEKNTEIENTIQGKWNVVQIIGGFSPAKNYEEGAFTWFFDLDNKTVTINNKDVFNTLYAPTFTNDQGGVYTFDISTENKVDYLLVDKRKGTITLTDSELTIDFGIAFDDIAYIFKR